MTDQPKPDSGDDVKRDDVLRRLAKLPPVTQAEFAEQMRGKRAKAREPKP